MELTLLQQLEERCLCIAHQIGKKEAKEFRNYVEWAIRTMGYVGIVKAVVEHSKKMMKEIWTN